MNDLKIVLKDGSKLNYTNVLKTNYDNGFVLIALKNSVDVISLSEIKILSFTKKERKK